MTSKFTIGLCQMKVVDNKDHNIQKALNMLEKGVTEGAQLLILPEMFNCPYDNNKFEDYAESVENSPTLNAMSHAASELDIHLIAGSIPEKTSQGIYNTSFVFNPAGEIIGSHHKMHLFDIDIPQKITFKESDILSAGNSVTVIETDICKIGLGICYDMRFPELSRLMALEGADILVFPGAFNLTTGPAHWETLIRCRSIDNQVFVAATSPALNKKASYHAYGHSMICDPWGEVIVQAGFEEKVLCAEVDLEVKNHVRAELPLLKNRRTDIYDVNKI